MEDSIWDTNFPIQRLVYSVLQEESKNPEVYACIDDVVPRRIYRDGDNLLLYCTCWWLSTPEEHVVPRGYWTDPLFIHIKRTNTGLILWELKFSDYQGTDATRWTWFYRELDWIYEFDF